jgi:hypothetical protein
LVIFLRVSSGIKDVNNYTIKLKTWGPCAQTSLFSLMHSGLSSVIMSYYIYQQILSTNVQLPLVKLVSNRYFPLLNSEAIDFFASKTIIISQIQLFMSL